MIIQGKKALVTGGARRVGKVIALALAKKGAEIVLHYHRSKEEALVTQSEIKALGVHCHLVQADLAQPEHVERLTREMAANQINPDILVNSASIFYRTPLETATERDWDTFMDTNLKSYFLLSRLLGLRMKNAGGGKIINIADWSGFRPYRDYAPYCASKGGLITLTKALARDLAPTVTVNAVAPGPVMMPEDMSEAEKEKIAEKTALGRWGKPEDVASAVLFLLENEYMTGAVLVVDGGRSIV